MKKNFIMLFLPLFLFFLSACTSNAVKYYEHGKYSEAVKATDKKEDLEPEEWLVRARSLEALNRHEEALDGILMYLLTTPQQAQTEDRKYAVDMFIDGGFSNELVILCLIPDDGLYAQIELYKAYSNVNDFRNARQILDNYLTHSLTYPQFATLVLNNPVECTYITSIFEGWYSKLTNSDKESFITLLYDFAKKDFLTEQSARSIIYLTQCLEDDSYYFKNSVLLSMVYKTRGRALEQVHDSANASAYYRKALSLNPEDTDLGKTAGSNRK